MRFQIANHEVDSQNICGLNYPNDMLDGVYIDLGKKFLFLSAHVDEHRDSIEQIIEADPQIIGCDMTECEEVPLDEAPHTYIIRRVADLIIRTAEQACIEACDD